MGNRTAKFISTLVASIVAGVPLAAVSQAAPTAQSAASAADDCLASPRDTAPQGQHWYYRLEHGTKRQCWYLRAEGAKVRQATAAQSEQTPPPPARTVSPPPHSLEDAHAEFTAPQANTPRANTQAMTAPTPAMAPATTQNKANDSSAQQPAVAERWPDTPASSPEPAPQAAPATTMDDTPPNPKPAAASSPVTLATAEIPALKPTGSLPTLLLVIVGALALAGITASVIYRFAGSRRGRVQASEARRRVNWGDGEQPADNSRAPWADATPALAPRVQRPRPVDFDLALLRAAKPDLAHDRARIEPREAHTEIAAKEPDEVVVEEFEAETPAPQVAMPPQVAMTEAHPEPADLDAEAVDIDVITEILERLAKEGPRLSQPSPEAGFADFAQSRPGRSAARA